MIDLIPIVLLCLVVFGIVLVLYTFFKLRDSNDVISLDLESENYIKALNESFKEADNTMNEMDKLSESIKKELDDKYQEILYLYSMVEEKKNELLAVQQSIQKIKKSKPNKPKTDKINNIENLYRQGYSYSEIARVLDIGQGEVELTLDLMKDRA